jgi:hypothetical protein
MSRGYYRSYGDVYPNTIDMNTGNIVSAEPDRTVNYFDFDTVIRRWVGYTLRGDDVNDLNKYDWVDLNRVLSNYGQEIPEDPNNLSNINIKELCSSSVGIEHMENTFNIDADLICDNEHDCSGNTNANFELLCPNGQSNSSDILNPLKLLCESGVNCSHPDTDTGECISNILGNDNCNGLIERECDEEDGCVYEEPVYNYPCIVYANRCKQDAVCNEAMINISQELSDTNDITQETFKICRDNDTCKDLMDCSLNNITSNNWSIRGQCSNQQFCNENNNSWPCLTVQNENYYRCNSVISPEVFNNSNCYCSGVPDSNGEGVGYEQIRGLGRDELYALVGQLEVESGSTTGTPPSYDSASHDDFVRIVAGYDKGGLINDDPGPGQIRLEELQYPLCESTYYGVPFCYTDQNVCVDGKLSDINNGYDISYEACNNLSLNRINNNASYNSDTWDINSDGGYWKHYIINHYGLIRECDNTEIEYNNECIECTEQSGCMLSDKYATCLHLGNGVFSKECEYGYPYIGTFNLDHIP